ncbi:hypothetical protein [Embleya sp. NBC_00896]|uniref:hypothetical protein n=1 Tax=Embleya sp. NBC_00896 TaxID=2975961 RepID=UPI002F919835|nr:hypothetical protein OG928_38480 [Embleya sp. NBC_00896]
MSLVAHTIAPTSDDPDALAEGTVLSYELTTDPDPIRVSPATGTVELADLVIVGSRQAGTAIEARKLTVYIPTGTASAELALDLTGIAAQISLPGWTPTSDPTNQRIVFAPPSDATRIEAGAGVTIQLGGIRVNRQVGSVPIPIELEYRAVGTSAWRTDTTTLGIGKFPAGFYLRNLIVRPLIVDNGGSATLTWEASEGATYKLLYDLAEVDVTSRRTYPVTNVRHTTVFYVRGIAQSGNNTVERTISTTLVVNEPDLVVNNLTINGITTANGELVANGQVTAKRDLAVTGSATVGRNTTLRGTLGVDGEVTTQGIVKVSGTGLLLTKRLGHGDGGVIDVISSIDQSVSGGISTRGQVTATRFVTTSSPADTPDATNGAAESPPADPTPAP